MMDDDGWEEDSKAQWMICCIIISCSYFYFWVLKVHLGWLGGTLQWMYVLGEHWC